MKATKIFLCLVFVSIINCASAFTGGFGKDKKPNASKSNSVITLNNATLNNKLFTYKPLNTQRFLNAPDKFNSPIYRKSTVMYKKNNVMYIKPVYTKINVNDKLTYNNILKVFKSN